MQIVGDVAGRACIIVDDMVDTAGTMVKGVCLLKVFCVNIQGAIVFQKAHHWNILNTNRLTPKKLDWISGKRVFVRFEVIVCLCEVTRFHNPTEEKSSCGQLDCLFLKTLVQLNQVARS